jgi:molecular chaperone GrpE
MKNSSSEQEQDLQTRIKADKRKIESKAFMSKGRNTDLEEKDHEELVPAHSASDDDGNSARPSEEATRNQSGTSVAEGAGDPKDQLVRLQAERDALFDRLARQQAEFENLRKRSAKEQQDFREYAASDVVKQLIPILDSFDLALKSQSANEGDLRKGLELIRKQMDELLTKLGVQAVPAKGQPFDPRFHEAIEMVESSDVKDNHVLDELQRGYKIKDRLLRPAMVRVAKNK